jgi:hypothetical protein
LIGLGRRKDKKKMPTKDCVFKSIREHADKRNWICVPGNLRKGPMPTEWPTEWRYFTQAEALNRKSNPPKPKLTGQPAKGAAKMAKLLTIAYEGPQDWRASIVDALVDLRHLADRQGVDLGAADKMAHQHYLAEKGEESKCLKPKASKSK